MITQAEALKYFEYKDGNLYWKTAISPKTKVGSIVGTINGQGRKQVGLNWKIYGLHRIIFLIHYGYFPKEVDHIDGNPLNNKIENLREATRSEQLCNTRLRKDSTSGIKGVMWHKLMKKWLVRVYKHKKVIYKNYFDDIELANLVAVEARNKYHGKFTRCQ
jgi:hypothetical protein